MLNNYTYSFKAVLKFEGGFSNDPHDPGGATNLGIIQTEYNAYRNRKSLPQQSVRNITQAEANDIYKAQYWDRVNLDDYPAGVDFAIFDCAVNNGVGAVQKFAQRANNRVGAQKIAVDGTLGIVSHDSISKCPPEAFIDALCDERLRFDRGLKIWKYFGTGWTRRVNGDPRTGDLGVRGKAKALALKARGITPPLAPVITVSRETPPSFWRGIIDAILSWLPKRFGGQS